MLAELGRRADAAVTRGTDALHEAVHATALHLRRIAGAVTEAAGRVTRETRDLVWDFQDVASDLRGETKTVGGGPAVEQRVERPALRVVNSGD